MAGPQPLQGTRVLAAPRLLAALGAAERQALRRGVEALGGEWQAKFKAAPTARPHVVLARDVLGETYLQVLAAARGTPVVAPAWVDACRRQARSEPFDAYKVAPLKGTVVCVTGIPLDRRAQLQKEIRAQGGEYTGDLSAKCTHLIALRAAGDKYFTAVGWPDTDVVTEQWLRDSLRLEARQDEAKYPVTALPAAGKAPRNPSGARAPSDPATKRSAETKRSAGGRAGGAGGGPLEGLRVWLVGFGDRERRELVALVRETGATRHVRPGPRVTHALVGPAPLAAAEVQQLRELEAGGAPGASAAWFRRCCARGAVHAPAGAERVGWREAEARAGPGPGGGAAAPPAPPPRRALPGRKGGVFAGLCFALQGLGSPQREEAASKLILAGGGQLLAAPGSVSAQGYVVCPLDPRGAARRRGGAAPAAEAARVRATKVTTYWLEWCLQNRTLYPPSKLVFFQPLQWDFPLKSAEGLVVCISQYEDAVRAAARDLCAVLGFRFSEKLVRRETTHLLLPKAEGEKYKHAVKWGQRTATIEWLYAIARGGLVVPPDDFRPRPGAAAAGPGGGKPRSPPAARATPRSQVPRTQAAPPAARPADRRRRSLDSTDLLDQVARGLGARPAAAAPAAAPAAPPAAAARRPARAKARKRAAREEPEGFPAMSQQVVWDEPARPPVQRRGKRGRSHSQHAQIAQLAENLKQTRRGRGGGEDLEALGF